MSFIVITSAESYDLIVESGEMPDLIALGAEIVLVRPLFDELARDPATADFIGQNTPPFSIIRLHPWSRVYTAVSDYMRNYGRDRFAAGEPGVLVMVDAGDWITFNREPNRYLAIAGPGCVDGIKVHLGLT